MSDHLVESFGELPMKRVRDKAIGEWERIIDGQAKGAKAERLREQISRLGPDQTKLLHTLLPQIVDTTLHHLLWTIEQEPSVDIIACDNQGIVRSVRSASDGLSGEPYGERGWIARFSEKAKNPL